MNLPIVSVIMITYGHEKHIEQAILSILEQQCDFDFELIISNDCSPDNTNSIVNTIIDSHPKSNLIKYTNHKTNLGSMNNFVWTLQQAKGTYIAICEGDDYWTDSLKLQKQVNFFKEKPEMVFCFHGAKTIDSNSKYGVYYKSDFFKNKEIVPEKYFVEKGGAGYCTASALFKKEIINDLPNYFKKCFVGDFPLALIAISQGEIGYLDDEMAVYRIMGDGSWSTLDSNIIFKEKKIQNSFITINEFNEFTNYKYNSIAKNLKSLCSYQFLYSYFSTNKSKQNRFNQFKIYNSELNIKHRVVILLKLLIT